jgi:hypothetical protein
MEEDLTTGRLVNRYRTQYLQGLTHLHLIAHAVRMDLAIGLRASSRYHDVVVKLAVAE